VGVKVGVGAGVARAQPEARATTIHRSKSRLRYKLTILSVTQGFRQQRAGCRLVYLAKDRT